MIFNEGLKKENSKQLSREKIELFRRGKEAANIKWGVCPAVMAGNYIIAASSQLLASFNNDQVTIIISRIIEDLIHGELCQMEAIQSTHTERYKQEM